LYNFDGQFIDGDENFVDVGSMFTFDIVLPLHIRLPKANICDANRVTKNE
jgi:hypothetical protein